MLNPSLNCNIQVHTYFSDCVCFVWFILIIGIMLSFLLYVASTKQTEKGKPFHQSRKREWFDEPDIGIAFQYFSMQNSYSIYYIANELLLLTNHS